MLYNHKKEIPKTVLEKEVKTLWAGRAWIHAKYLNQAQSANIPLVIVHKHKTMTITPDRFREVFTQNKEVDDKFKPGVIHKQYGVVFRQDDKNNPPENHNQLNIYNV